MPNNTFVYLIVAIVIIHFLFAAAYLIYKIMKAPTSSNTDQEDKGEKEQNDSF